MRTVLEVSGGVAAYVLVGFLCFKTWMHISPPEVRSPMYWPNKYTVAAPIGGTATVTDAFWVSVLVWPILFVAIAGRGLAELSIAISAAVERGVIPPPPPPRDTFLTEAEREVEA